MQFHNTVLPGIKAASSNSSLTRQYGLSSGLGNSLGSRLTEKKNMSCDFVLLRNVVFITRKQNINKFCCSTKVILILVTNRDLQKLFVPKVRKMYNRVLEVLENFFLCLSVYVSSRHFAQKNS